MSGGQFGSNASWSPKGNRRFFTVFRMTLLWDKRSRAGRGIGANGELFRDYLSANRVDAFHSLDPLALSTR
jgi:hypothetical protein